MATTTATRVIPETPVRIVLELDERDAQVMLHVLRRVGGDPEGPRSAINRIVDALCDAHVECVNYTGDCFYVGEVHLRSKW